MKKEFTKSDLKDGMVVEYKDERRRLVVDNMLIGQDGWLNLRSINYDLKHFIDDCESLDIAKVYKIKLPRNFMTLLDDDNLELIWERTETKRMTTEEMRVRLEGLTGEKIEIEPSREEIIGACYVYCDNKQFCKGCVITEMCHDNGSQFVDYCDDELKKCYEKMIANKN